VSPGEAGANIGVSGWEAVSRFQPYILWTRDCH